MPVTHSIGHSIRLCTRPGTSWGRRRKTHARNSRIADASTAPTMLLVTVSGPIVKSGSALMET